MLIDTHLPNDTCAYLQASSVRFLCFGSESFCAKSKHYTTGTCTLVCAIFLFRFSPNYLIILLICYKQKYSLFYYNDSAYYLIPEPN